MKLTLKQEWKPRPLNSFLGVIDLKIGVTIAFLFALLNKVAGVYGLIAVFTGGSFAQLSMYIYSVGTLIALIWALKAVADEDARKTLYFAHLFFLDHILSTVWIVFFGVVWWVYTPHDGRRQANSAAQEELMKGGAGHDLTVEERTAAALMIWNKEKTLAATVIIAGWCCKIYFIILIYSFAIHLRKGSYRSLPASSQSSSSQYAALGSKARSSYPVDALGDEDDELADDFYRLPTLPQYARTPDSNTGSSVGSFADFVSAPGRGRRTRAGGLPSALSGKKSLSENDGEVEEELLFDSDEMGHSKFGTDETTSISSREDEGQSRERAGYSKHS